jgi:hypothetical protein
MKKLILLLLLLPTLSFSQDITGVWVKSPEDNEALEFKADGSFDILDLSNPETKVLRNLTVTYELSEADGITYIIYHYYRQGKTVQQEKIKYKLKKGKLYLPRTITSNGVERVEDYADEYTRIEK